MFNEVILIIISIVIAFTGLFILSDYIFRKGYEYCKLEYKKQTLEYNDYDSEIIRLNNQINEYESTINLQNNTINTLYYIIESSLKDSIKDNKEYIELLDNLEESIPKN